MMFQNFKCCQKYITSQIKNVIYIKTFRLINLLIILSKYTKHI